MTEQKQYTQLAALDRLIVGTAGLAGLWGKVNLTESVDTILLAMESGIKAFDTAPAYNQAEAIVGMALQQWRGPKPKISTKCGRLKADSPTINHYDYSPSAIRRSVEESLNTMRLDFIDILFLHDPVSLKSEEEVVTAIETMLQLKEEGLTKGLGIGGNYPQFFKPFVRKEYFTAFMGYNRYNAVCTDALEEEHTFLQEQQIAIWQASPLYNGLLGSRFEKLLKEKPEWIPAAHFTRAKSLSEYCTGAGVELPEVALRFVQSNSNIDKVVIGAINQKEFTDTMTYWKKGPLPEIEIKAINQFH